MASNIYAKQRANTPRANSSRGLPGGGRAGKPKADKKTSGSSPRERVEGKGARKGVKKGSILTNKENESRNVTPFGQKRAISFI